MDNQKNYRPEGFHSITPYLILNGASQFIQFVKEAFDAEELVVYMKPGTNLIMHAAVRIGDSTIEVSDSTAEYPAMRNALHLYVPDVDSVFKKAVQAGGKSIFEPRNQFYGDRESFIEDAFGNHWYISTHVKDVTEQELAAHAM